MAPGAPRLPLAARLAAYADGLRYDDLDEATVERVKVHIIDALGCGLAAFDERPVRICRDVVLANSSSGSATIIGTKRQASADLAAFANCAAVRYLDLNDAYVGHITGHPSDNISACLAVAEAERASAAIVGRDRELKNRRQESPQKRPVSHRRSDTNRSPCYLANIRVIFEKNSERITKSPRSARRPVVFHFLGKFENREKQGASIGANREMSLPIQVRKSSERPSAQLTVWAGLVPKRTYDRRGRLNGKVRNVLVSRSVPTESRVLSVFNPKCPKLNFAVRS